MFHGKTHYFYGHGFNSYFVKLPEGILHATFRRPRFMNTSKKTVSAGMNPEFGKELMSKWVEAPNDWESRTCDFLHIPYLAYLEAGGSS